MSEFLQDAEPGGYDGYDAGYGDGGEPELFLDQAGQVVDGQGQPVDVYGQLAETRQALGYERERGPDPELQARDAEIADLRSDAAAVELEERYPLFRDPEVAEAIVSRAEQIAAQRGQPELGRDPELIEAIMVEWLDQGGDYSLRLDRAIDERVRARSFWDSTGSSGE